MFNFGAVWNYTFKFAQLGHFRADKGISFSFFQTVDFLNYNNVEFQIQWIYRSFT